MLPSFFWGLGWSMYPTTQWSNTARQIEKKPPSQTFVPNYMSLRRPMDTRIPFPYGYESHADNLTRASRCSTLGIRWSATLACRKHNLRRTTPSYTRLFKCGIPFVSLHFSSKHFRCNHRATGTHVKPLFCQYVNQHREELLFLTTFETKQGGGGNGVTDTLRQGNRYPSHKSHY